MREELRRSGFEEVIAAGIVLTGGSAKMEGAIELAEEVFHVPVRLGLPQAGAGPRRRGAQSDLFDRRGAAALRPRQRSCPRVAGARSAATRKSVLDRMRSWFQGNF